MVTWNNDRVDIMYKNMSEQDEIVRYSIKKLIEEQRYVPADMVIAHYNFMHGTGTFHFQPAGHTLY